VWWDSNTDKTIVVVGITNASRPVTTIFYNNGGLADVRNLLQQTNEVIPAYMSQ
jgi:hypothetical protein